MNIHARFQSCLQKWHSAQNKLNRSPAESKTWYCQQAVGHIGHINDILGKLCDKQLLSKVGCHTEEAASLAVVSLPASHPTVENDDITAASIGKFVVAVARRRARSMAWFTTYPYKFAGLLSAEHGPRILQDMKQDWEVACVLIP